MKKVDFPNQSGQAFMELTVMLIGITAMILAVIVLFGIENTSNDLLLDARFAAHKAARDANSQLRENEYETWYETTLELDKNRISPNTSATDNTNHATLFSERGRTYILSSNKKMLGKNLLIPFSLAATKQQNGNNNSIAPAIGGLDSALYSRTSQSNVYQPFDKYKNWRMLNDFDAGFRHDIFPVVSGNNAFYAAQLVRGDSSLSGAPSTINAAHQRGPLNSASNASNIMYDSFYKLFGIRIKTSEIKNHPGNHVYMPITDKVLSE